MDRTVYKTKIDWWIPAVFIFTVTVAFIGPLIDGEIFIVGIIIATLLCALEIAMFGSVKYQIRDNAKEDSNASAEEGADSGEDAGSEEGADSGEDAGAEEGADSGEDSDTGK